MDQDKEGGLPSDSIYALHKVGIAILVQLHNKMKNCPMSMNDKIILRKRSVLETPNNELKNIGQLEHSRRRSFINFIVNILAGTAGYSFFPKKPSIKYETIKNQPIVRF
jgi:hypothetical protein